jgi:hypothetical protein
MRKEMAMNAVVFEHVPVAELPERWRAKLSQGSGALVTVRIEEEAQAAPAEEFTTDDPAFGIWRDRDDVADVAAYARKLRQPRYNRDGSRNES